MTLEWIYYISQIVAVIVIVATLFAILWQGYQTNKIARADLTLSMWLQTGQMHYQLIDSPEKSEFIHRALFGSDRLTDAEKIRLGNILGLATGTFEAAFNLRDRGLVEAAAYERNAVITAWYLSSPRARKWWRFNREIGYAPRIREAIDAMASKYEPAESSNPERETAN